MPCLITALSELNEPRYMTPGGIFDACDKEVTVWGRADLKDVDDSNLGLKGSPTKIAKASDKVPKGAGESKSGSCRVRCILNRKIQRETYYLRL